ncbi:MAG: hypothetical protein M1812_004834 [Candelaria pacifica]|nr:MAG: hypothetical protein M1812_004834 [Candelaria pacifica]
MGLSGSRKRAKISNDPRNTNWSRSTSTFGHKILTAQGWTPGSFLGAQDASHAEFHTEANASHIRVAMKDDNLGVGARGSRQPEGECVGLDAFQGLLGRLNGKSDQTLEKEQQSRNDVKRVLYTERRWGGMHFVKGGLLVGDKIETALPPTTHQSAVLTEQNATRDPAVATDANGDGESRTLRRKRKDRPKAEERSVNPAIEKESLQDTELAIDPQGTQVTETDKPFVAKVPLSDRNLKKQRRQKNADSLAMPVGVPARVFLSSTRNAEELSQEKLDKAKRKSERRERRERKRLRKEQRTARIEGVQSSISNQRISKHVVSDVGGSAAVTTKEQVTAVPATSCMLTGRHSVRQRHIQHKKMAVMDPRALNEIFMIKA